jgi:hypothetical protein
VDDPSPQEPPARVQYGLEEALDLLAALEEVCALTEPRHL